jgi:hypothetical protein
MSTGFFNKFPQVGYDLSNQRPKYFTVLTDITARVSLLDQAKNNPLLFYTYDSKDTDKPEIIAAKLYSDPTKHWTIFLANDMVDPLYDFVLNYDNFNRYIIAKYGSIEAAQTNVASYGITISKTDSRTGKVTETALEIDAGQWANTAVESFQTVDLVDGTSIHIVTTRTSETFYDFEQRTNESLRTIKLIKGEIIGQIDKELATLMSSSA